MRSSTVIRAEIRILVDRLGALRKECTAAVQAERRARLQPKRVTRRWQGEALLRLQEDYESGRLLRLIARDHKTSEGCICNLAFDHGWKRRPLEVAQRAFAMPRDSRPVEQSAVGSP